MKNDSLILNIIIMLMSDQPKVQFEIQKSVYEVG